MNRRKVGTFFLSLAIHIIIIFSIWLLLQKSEEKRLDASSAKRVEISLEDFTTPAPMPAPAAPKPKVQPIKKAVKPKTPKPPQKEKSAAKPKPKPIKKEIKREPAPKAIEKENPKKSTLKPKPKERVEPETKRVAKAEKIVSKDTNESRAESKRSENRTTPLSKLAGALGTPAMAPSTPKPPSIAEIGDALSNREFKALYKDDFDRFSPEQKRFIKDNLSRIQGITQHYLTIRGYPYLAARLGQAGMNIVEFDLHPNGDITGLKIIQGSESEILDKNSLDTIKTAYKDYPRPKETTKIRFYIYYRLY
ncbi:MAG: TonB family protein [Hydrogenimonas sp.]|nr:TonB family protein [Hydrogenimonas sp.]